MPGACEATCTHTGSKELKDEQFKSILSLPDDVVYKMLIMASSYSITTRRYRTSLPLVCKKWREILFFQGRPLKRVILDSSEHYSLSAVGQWLVQQQGRGLLCHPMTMHITGSGNHTHTLESANGPQELSVCLGILGPALHELCLEYCETQLFTSNSLRKLWTCPSLCSLTLNDCSVSLDAEDLKAGLQHLRLLEELSIWHEDDVEGAEHTFPAEIFGRLSNLQTICLRNNKFTGAPSALAHLSQLQCLRLDTCTWRCRFSVPVVMGSSLKNLTLRNVVVQADGDHGLTEPFSTMLLWESMKGLLVLDLDAGVDAELPRGVLACTKLQLLDLHNFEGLDLQPCFSDLGHLLVLRFTDCSFQQPPAWVSQLQSLHHLEMDGCRMPAQHAAWSGASALQSFECHFSTMNKACLSVCNFTSLTCLSLQLCSLSSVDPAMENLRALEDLDISYNQLYPEVPQELARLTTLTRLNLSCNAANRKAGVPLKRVRGRIYVPKMRITQQRCRFLLLFPRLALLELTVTKEEQADLTGLLTSLEQVRNGAIRFSLDIREDFIPENAGLE